MSLERGADGGSPCGRRQSWNRCSQCHGERINELAVMIQQHSRTCRGAHGGDGREDVDDSIVDITVPQILDERINVDALMQQVLPQGGGATES